MVFIALLFNPINLEKIEANGNYCVAKGDIIV
jgi:hypothetical protein